MCKNNLGLVETANFCFNLPHMVIRLNFGYKSVDKEVVSKSVFSTAITYLGLSKNNQPKCLELMMFN